MTSPSETVEKFQRTLDSYIKPREQVNYIRRVLALHLGSSSYDGPLKQPASLADISHDVTIGKELRGVQREYVAALKANVEARRKYEEAAQANAQRPDSTPQSPSPKPDVLEERLALIKLQNKQQRLALVREYLDVLDQKPAASPSFLGAEEIFEGTGDLPGVPKEVVNSLVAEKSTAKPDLKGQLTQLEKTVLRSKLLLRREEQLLQETRAKSEGIPDVLSNGTRLEALKTTRTELIDWVETELSKASGGDDGEEHETHRQHRDKSNLDKAKVDKQLADIKEKYTNYMAARKSLLESMTQRSGSSRPPVLKPNEASNSSGENAPSPGSYLLTPYIETLLSISRKQKGMITQKSHMSSVLGRQSKDAGQVLNHLAEESQLLPQYPLKGATRRRSGMGDEMVLTSSERAGLSGNIQPWVFAADSSKIATLETVAEKVEGGQVALEDTMKTLQDIDHLLGLDQADQPDLEEEPTDDDVWLNTSSKTPTSARKHTDKKKKGADEQKDLWSNLHGNLGLLGNDDTI